MVATTASTISVTAPSRTFERLANAALSPGHVVELISTDKVQKAGTAARPYARLVALEQSYIGKGITTAYASADQVICGVFDAGAEVTLRLPASAAAVVIGDRLQVNADGTVKKLVGPLTTSVGTGDGTVADVGAAFSQTTLNNNFKDVADAVNLNTVFAIALEAVDNSGGGSEAFIKAMLL